MTLTAKAWSKSLTSRCADRGDGAEHAGIADQPVELAPALEDRRAQPVDAVAVAQIERHERRFAAGRLDVVVEFFETAHRARDGDDMRAAAARFERGLIADAAARPGDEDDLARESRTSDQLASRISESVLGSVLPRPVRSVSVVG